LVIAYYRLVSALPKSVTVVTCRTSDLLGRQGKHTADAAFGLNDPPRAWMGSQLGTRPQDPHTDDAVEHVVVSDFARVNVVDVDEVVDEAAPRWRSRSMPSGGGARPTIAANL
jgi:hypothetical protein